MTGAICSLINWLCWVCVCVNVCVLRAQNEMRHGFRPPLQRKDPQIECNCLFRFQLRYAECDSLCESHRKTLPTNHKQNVESPKQLPHCVAPMDGQVDDMKTNAPKGDGHPCRVGRAESHFRAQHECRHFGRRKAILWPGSELAALPSICHMMTMPDYRVHKIDHHAPTQVVHTVHIQISVSSWVTMIFTFRVRSVENSQSN